MRSDYMRHRRTLVQASLIASVLLIGSGCVSTDTHQKALDELENDHDFLLQGDVFTADVIHYWIKYKRENEVDAIRMRPHPYEFCMYFDI